MAVEEARPAPWVGDIKDGVMTDAPIWGEAAGVRPYMATIFRDPSSPGGIGRSFVEKAAGDGKYYKVTGLSIGDAVEFQAAGVTERGKVAQQRWYGVITHLTQDRIEIQYYSSAKRAFIAALSTPGKGTKWPDLSGVPYERLVEETRRRDELTAGGKEAAQMAVGELKPSISPDTVFQRVTGREPEGDFELPSWMKQNNGGAPQRDLESS